MKMGTKSVLFGGHQFIIHPVFVIISWIILYKSIPSIKEIICIFLHDIGYIGVEDIKGDDGDKHPELGAKIAERLFGPKYRNFILGHSHFYSTSHNIPRSKLLSPDKYYYNIMPFPIFKFLTSLSGEFNYYRSLSNNRQVANKYDTDKEWYNKIKLASKEKIEGIYINGTIY